MNVFYLDEDPAIAAVALCDSHVIKMISESVQLLSTAHHLLPTTVDREVLPKRTHENHPSAKWVRETRCNYFWLFRHYFEMSKEYYRRYGRHHDYFDLAYELAVAPSIAAFDRTSVPLAMPDRFKTTDPVYSYRLYYASKYDTITMSWKTKPPSWFKHYRDLYKVMK